MNFTLHLTDLQAAFAWNTSIIWAVTIAFFIHWKEGKRQGFEPLTWLTFLAVVYASVIFGERIGAFGLADWIGLFDGKGLPATPKKTFLGSALLVLPVILILKKWWRLPARMVDTLLLPIPLAAAIGRVGCLLAGCCFGSPTMNGWGISYGPGSPAYNCQMADGLLPYGATETMGTYPVQLFFVVSGMLSFVLLWRIRKQIKQPGSLALAALILLLGNRFFIEFFREAITARGFLGEMIGNLKVGQWFCLVVALISLLVYCWREREDKQFTSTEKKELNGHSFLLKASLLLIIAFGGLLLRSVLTLEEKVILLIVCLPAIFSIGKKLWQSYERRPIFAPAAMLSVSTLILLAMPLDTLPPMAKGQQWIELGAGGVAGSYSDVQRDCSGNEIGRDKIKTSSFSFDGSYNWGLKNGRSGIGFRVASGSTEMEEINNSAYNDFSFNALGLYGIIDKKAFGMRFGFLTTDRHFNKPFDQERDNLTVPNFHIRVGKLHRVYFDMSVYDSHAFSFFPEPSFSMAFNYGFNDASGATRLRGGFGIIQEESGLVLTMSGPIADSPFILEGGLFAQRGIMASLGLRYRFYLRQ